MNLSFLDVISPKKVVLATFTHIGLIFNNFPSESILALNLLLIFVHKLFEKSLQIFKPWDIFLSKGLHLLYLGAVGFWKIKRTISVNLFQNV